MCTEFIEANFELKRFHAVELLLHKSPKEWQQHWQQPTLRNQHYLFVVDVKE